MKESYYNIYSELPNGSYICLNTRLYSFAILPSHIVFLLKRNLVSQIPNKYIESLKECGSIVDENVDEFQLLNHEHLNAISNKCSTYELTLLPSLDCNLRCWYCFESHIKGSHLEQQTQTAILNFIHNIYRTDHITHINIELFGGEPLLHFKNEVYPLLKEITKIADTYSKSVSFFFVTNATLITREMIPLFAEINARFQISIDGFKDKHDKVKRDINRLDDSTYDKVMQTIRWLTDEYPDCYINLRVNYDSTTLQHIPELLYDIENIDHSKLGFHLERIWQTKKTDGSGKAVVEAMKSILSNGYTVSYMNFSRRSCSCKSSRINQAVISYDRRIYKCSGRNFTEELQEGVLTAEGNICWNQDKLRKRLSIITFENKKCKACKLLPLCWGPCNQKLIEHPEKVEVYCQLNQMEISLDDFVFMAFNNELLRNKIYKTE